MNVEKASPAFIAVGSNVEPEHNIPAALDLLQQTTIVAATSQFFRTMPVGKNQNQPMFWNGVWEIRSGLPPLALKFQVLRDIEARLGRIRSSSRYDPRPIDLDLILFADLKMRNPRLILPDPDIQTRPFIAIPLRELTGDRVLPGFQNTLSEWIAKMDTSEMELLESFSQGLKERIHP